MKKRIILLAINSKFIHSNLAVWLIKAGIEQYGKSKYDVNVSEVTIHQPIDEIVDAIIVSKPDVIGISVYIWNAPILPDLIYALRERLPNALIVLGGPEAEYNKNYWLEKGADHVLSGEGEYVFPAFLDNHFSSPSLDTKYLHPPDPYTNEYLKTLENRLIYIESSRGCPYKCAYCLSAETNVEFFPIDVIKERLLKLSKLDSKTVKFVDRTFNCNINRANDLFKFITDLSTNCSFHFEVAADLFDEQTLD